MSGLVVTERGRKRAYDMAQAMGLHRTAMFIRAGRNPELIKNLAGDEYMNQHKNCPCCRGLLSKATEVASAVYHSMFDYPTGGLSARE